MMALISRSRSALRRTYGLGKMVVHKHNRVVSMPAHTTYTSTYAQHAPVIPRMRRSMPYTGSGVKRVVQDRARNTPHVKKKAKQSDHRTSKPSSKTSVKPSVKPSVKRTPLKKGVVRGTTTKRKVKPVIIKRANSKGSTGNRRHRKINKNNNNRKCDNTSKTVNHKKRVTPHLRIPPKF